MGSVAASALIGNMHPNDGRICPTHIALLWEGNRSAWVISDLAGPARKTWRPYTYERNVPELLALLAVVILGAVPNNERMLKRDVTMVASDSEELDRLAAFTLDFKGMAISVTIIDESAGLGLQNVKEFGHRDLAIFTPS